MSGYVYLIGSSTFGWYKIGKSVTPEIRVKNIGVLLPFKIMVIGVWKSNSHSLLEFTMHQRHAKNRINGEWFKFSKQNVEELFELMSGEKLVFRLGSESDSAFAKFTNVEADCPEGHKVRFKIKKMLGDFTPEQRNAIRIASMVDQANKRIAAGKPITDGQRKALESVGLSLSFM